MEFHVTQKYFKRQLTRGHKQCWHFTRVIIPQLVKTYCNKMPKRFAIRTAHTAKRCSQCRPTNIYPDYLHESK
jgi:hypothetical protein